jgi:hypothetical protein
MFSALRIIVVVGVIFYLSPVRTGDEPPVRMDELLRWGQAGAGQDRTAQDTTPTAAPATQAAHLQSLWQALPDGAKRAVVEEVVGIGSGTTAAHADQPHAAEPQPSGRIEPRKRP